MTSKEARSAMLAGGTLINTDTIFNVAEQERLGRDITAQAESSSEARQGRHADVSRRGVVTPVSAA